MPQTDPAPPSDRAAEKALLGSMLRDAGIVPEVLTLVRAAHYHVFAHVVMHVAIEHLHQNGVGIDIVTVATRLADQGAIQEIGGYGYLQELYDSAPAASHYRDYAASVRRCAQRRQAITLADDLRAGALDYGDDPAVMIAHVEERLHALIDDGASGGYRFAPLSSAEFANADYRPEWLASRLLVARQPCILGGPKKALKTSTIVDLSLSLATASPVLCAFAVSRPRRTLLISGESGEHTIQETARRVAVARGIDLERADVLWDFRLPQLANERDLRELGRGLRARGVEVVIIDPLYLTLLAGQAPGGVQASNLYEIGPLLLRVARACLDAGATPILIHHAKKTRQNGYESMDLDDLAFAGVAEFARQWMLLSRREKYEPGSGVHRLWLTAGGSMGHGGTWAVDVDEGTLDDRFGGRRWAVTVTSYADSRAAEQGAAAQRQNQKDREDDAAVLVVLDRLDPDRRGWGVNDLCDKAPISRERARQAINRMVSEGVLEEIKGFQVPMPKGASKGARGVRRKPAG